MACKWSISPYIVFAGLFLLNGCETDPPESLGDTDVAEIEAVIE